jgi:hypothetical protein
METLASETRESLERESGFRWLPFSRSELHVYNIRHVQHHTGQLSAYVRGRYGLAMRIRMVSAAEETITKTQKISN